MVFCFKPAGDECCIHIIMVIARSHDTKYKYITYYILGIRVLVYQVYCTRVPTMLPVSYQVSIIAVLAVSIHRTSSSDTQVAAERRDSTGRSSSKLKVGIMRVYQLGSTNLPGIVAAVNILYNLYMKNTRMMRLGWNVIPAVLCCINGTSTYISGGIVGPRGHGKTIRPVHSSVRIIYCVHTDYSAAITLFRHLLNVLSHATIRNTWRTRIWITDVRVSAPKCGASWVENDGRRKAPRGCIVFVLDVRPRSATMYTPHDHRVFN